jgi:hypothetical protein
VPCKPGRQCFQEEAELTARAATRANEDREVTMGSGGSEVTPLVGVGMGA